MLAWHNVLIDAAVHYHHLVHVAVGEALKQQSPYPQAVQQILARRRDEKHQPPPLAVAVPDKVKHYSIKPVSLAVYDKLSKESQDD